MNLSKQTIALFKNFAGINSNLSIKAGNKLTTVSAGKNIVAQADITEMFPVDFGIYDLNEFLGAMSLFDNPNLEFDSKCVTIKEGKNSVKYYGANQSILTPVPNIKQFHEPDIEFDLSSSMLVQILRVSSILHVPDFSLVGNGSTITVAVTDKSNPTGNTFESELGLSDKEFKVNFKVENLR